MDEHDRLEAQYNTMKARDVARHQAELREGLELALGILDEHEICCLERDRCQAIADKANALAAAASGGDVKQAPAESPQSGDAEQRNAQRRSE